MAENGSAAAELAREVNGHILAQEARLNEISVHAVAAEQDVIRLFCECGCMGVLSVTRAEYDRDGGAWLEGHEPTSPR